LWTKVSKQKFVGRQTIEMGAHSAILDYNDGKKGILNVLDYFGCKGSVTEKAALKMDSFRVNKSSEPVQKRRKTLRTIKKGYQDKLKEAEPVESYSTGAH